MKIPLMRNAFLEESKTKAKLAEFILNANIFSMAEQCAKFELAFAEYQRCRYALLFNSGGSANLALLQALKSLGRLKDGAKVGFSALTWSTNVMPIIQLGMTPVPIDCSQSSLNVMSENILARLEEVELDAFFATNVLGYCGDLNRIKELCEERGIIFIEDNCESLGAEIEGDKTGNFGIASTFSFYVAHHMSTIEGGMLCTNDTELHKELMMVRANGWDRNLTTEQQVQMREPYNIDSFQAKYSFFTLGYNLRPTEITGFLGQEQMRYLDKNIAIRGSRHIRFEQAALSNDELRVVEHSHMDVVSPFGFVILCKTPELRVKYIEKFNAAGIEIRPIIAGNMQQQPFYASYVKEVYDLSNTDSISSCGFYCGNYPDLTDDEVEIICKCLSK